MSNQVILELIMAINLYCGLGSGEHFERNAPDTYQTMCFKRIWNCTHNVKDSGAMPSELNNCIDKHINKK